MGFKAKAVTQLHNQKQQALTHAIKQQGGWTFTGLLVVLLVAGVFVTVGFKLAPAYADHYTVKDIMEQVVEDRQLLAKTKNEISTTIIKRMRINNIREFPKEFFKIEKDKGTVTIILDYEVRTPVFANVDAVMSFKETYEGQALE